MKQKKDMTLDEYRSLSPSQREIVRLELAAEEICSGAKLRRVAAADVVTSIPRKVFGGFEKKRATRSSNPEGDLGLSADDYIVYPSHGVGQIVAIEKQEIAGVSLEVFVIEFKSDGMILRVPTAKATSVGIRSLSSPDLVAKALDTLKGRAKVKRAMWSRRAQAFKKKIHSGDLISIAEVVRDLYRGGDQPGQSYDERQLYELALERLTREVAAVERVEERNAAEKVDAALNFKAA